MDIRQSPYYGRFMHSLGWDTHRVGSWQAFSRRFFLFGSVIKIQRIGNPIPWKDILSLARRIRSFQTTIEFDYSTRITNTSSFHTKHISAPFIPTKTIHISLTAQETTLFHSFTPEKQRTIKKAARCGVNITHSIDIHTIMQLKKSSQPYFGLLIADELPHLWRCFFPKHATLLTAVHQSSTKPVAAVLLLHYQNTAYYWTAASSTLGNHLGAPSLLVWEAIKLSKKLGCRIFDFEGVYDERLGSTYNSWKGFSQFKRGFGGTTVQYPLPLSIRH